MGSFHQVQQLQRRRGKLPFLKVRHLPDLPIPTKRGNSGQEAKEREDCGGKGADKPRQGWTNSVVTSFDFGARSGDNKDDDGFGDGENGYGADGYPALVLMVMMLVTLY